MKQTTKITREPRRHERNRIENMKQQPNNDWQNAGETKKDYKHGTGHKITYKSTNHRGTQTES